MITRTLASAAMVFAAALTLVACGGGDDGKDAGVDGGGFGCVGFCGGDNDTDGGKDGGATDGGGTDGGGGDGGMGCYDGGLLNLTLKDIRDTNSICALPYNAHVKVQNVVVHTVSYSKLGTADYRADFWVSDVANPPYGLWISKFYTDLPGPYLPAPGDVLNIDGYYNQISQYQSQTGYRKLLQNKRVSGSTVANMELTKVSSGAPPAPIAVTAGMFGDADGGFERPDPAYAGTRVHVQGPVEIIDPAPSAFSTITLADGGGFYGFEITGGILVNNSKTFRSDGGCAWRDVALDAGSQGQKVVFTGGVQGVYDSYTYAACADGGTNPYCGNNVPGIVPGTNNKFTYVLYPESCADFVGGQVQ